MRVVKEQVRAGKRKQGEEVALEWRERRSSRNSDSGEWVNEVNRSPDSHKERKPSEKRRKEET